MQVRVVCTCLLQQVVEAAAVPVSQLLYREDLHRLRLVAWLFAGRRLASKDVHWQACTPETRDQYTFDIVWGSQE